MRTPHRFCALLRDLRQTAGLSLTDVHHRHGINKASLASYERGDRMPPVPVLEKILDVYGYRLVAVPSGPDAVRKPVDVAAELRMLADQVEATAARSATVREAATLVEVADILYDGVYHGDGYG